MNIIEVSYEQDGYALQFPESMVTDRLNRIFHALGHDAIEVSCSFVSDQTIRELNRDYRNKDEATDILSFPQEEDSDIVFPSSHDTSLYGSDASVEDTRLLGDIVVSLTSMQHNCEEFGSSFDEELFRLLIHGALHLLGYDHQTNDAKEPMLAKQELLLETLHKESAIEI